MGRKKTRHCDWHLPAAEMCAECLELRRKYIRESVRRYKKTAKGRESVRRYAESPQGIEACRKYYLNVTKPAREAARRNKKEQPCPRERRARWTP